MKRILNFAAIVVVLALLFLLVLGATGGSYSTALCALTLGVCAALLGHGKGEAR